MQDLDDIALLRAYAADGSEEAFASLVARHVNRVYSVALRHTGNSHQAEEITQVVFVILARKSGRLKEGVVLEGWLYQTARLASLAFLRGEARRTHREQEGFMQTGLNENEPDIWKHIGPLLDSAMASLNETDRHAVVLRFFYGKSMREVGAALGGSEGAATLRVRRALEKLRQFFARRGVISTTDALGSMISIHGVQAAPAALAKSITALAMTKGVAVSGSTSTLIKGALKIMAWSKAKTAVVVSVAVLLATATTTIIVKRNQAREAWRVWPGTFSAFDATLNSAPPQVRILPTKFPNRGSYGGGADGKLMGFDESIEGIAQIACASPTEYNWDSARTIVSPDVPKGRYDFIANLSKGAGPALQKEMEEKLGIVGKREMRNTDVLLLTVRHPNEPGLEPGAARNGGRNSKKLPNGELSFMNYGMSDLAVSLQRALNVPVVDETGLTGKFGFHIKWNPSDPAGIKQSLLDQLGLELVPTNMPVEMLVIEKAN